MSTPYDHRSDQSPPATDPLSRAIVQAIEASDSPRVKRWLRALLERGERWSSGQTAPTPPPTTPEPTPAESLAG